VHETFTSHSSSIPEGKPLWSHPLMLKVYINFAIQADSHNAFWRKTHQLTKGRRHLLFFLKVVLSVFSQRNTRRTSAPFRAGTRQGGKPVSDPLQNGIRFFLLLTPAPPSVCLTVSPARKLPGGDTGFPRSAHLPIMSDLGFAYYTGGTTSPYGQLGNP